MKAQIVNISGKVIAQTCHYESIKSIYDIILDALIMRKDYSAFCITDLPEKGTQLGTRLIHSMEGDWDCWECEECGLMWTFSGDSPEENEMYYCPKCGEKIIEYVEEVE